MQENDKHSCTDNSDDNRHCEKNKTLRKVRKLGGYEAGFSMAPDFDEVPECFKEYL